MKIDLNTHLLTHTRHAPSPYCDARPENTAIDLLVIHSISLPPNQFGNHFIEEFFCGRLNPDLHPYFLTIKDLRVSAHLLIRRSGEIIQFVPFSKRAWHAGQSFFKDKTQCNDFSIGIELEGCDDLPFEPIQYQQLALVSQLLQQNYPAITRERIVGHSDIAPGRKTDPGPFFDWQHFDCLFVK
jgi:AmpD protein